MDFKVFLRQIVSSIGRIYEKPGHFSSLVMCKFSHCPALEAAITSTTSSTHYGKVVLLELGHGGGDGIRRRRALAPWSMLGLLTSHCVPSSPCLGTPTSLNIKSGSFLLKRSGCDGTHPRLKPEIAAASSVVISYIFS